MGDSQPISDVSSKNGIMEADQPMEADRPMEAEHPKEANANQPEKASADQPKEKDADLPKVPNADQPKIFDDGQQKESNVVQPKVPDSGTPLKEADADWSKGPTGDKPAESLPKATDAVNSNVTCGDLLGLGDDDKGLAESLSKAELDSLLGTLTNSSKAEKPADEDIMGSTPDTSDEIKAVYVHPLTDVQLESKQSPLIAPEPLIPEASATVETNVSIQPMGDTTLATVHEIAPASDLTNKNTSADMTVKSHTGDFPLVKKPDENGAHHAVTNFEKQSCTADSSVPSEQLAVKKPAPAAASAAKPPAKAKPKPVSHGTPAKESPSTGANKPAATPMRTKPTPNMVSAKPPTNRQTAPPTKSPHKTPQLPRTTDVKKQVASKSVTNGTQQEKKTPVQPKTAAPVAQAKAKPPTAKPLGVSSTAPRKPASAKEKTGGAPALPPTTVHLKSVQAKVGSLDNVKHKPAMAPRCQVQSRKLDFNKSAKSKIGSLDNIKYKPAGGNVKIFEQKLNFKSKAQSKVTQEVKVPEKKEGVPEEGGALPMDPTAS